MPHILFDFDGVIVDSFAISYETACEFDSRITLDGYRRLFDGNIYQTWVEAGLRDPDVPDPAGEYAVRYRPKLLRLQPIEGISELLTSLSERYALSIVSSSSEPAIQSFLELHALQKHFTQILGFESGRSKTAKIGSHLEKHALEPRQCLFVTDTLGDLHEASKLGISSIGVTWGFHAAEDLQKGNPWALVHHSNDLPTVIHSFFQHEYART